LRCRSPTWVERHTTIAVCAELARRLSDLVLGRCLRHHRWDRRRLLFHRISLVRGDQSSPLVNRARQKQL